jgi:uncharacterized FlaG/YvyC family protein
VQIVHIALADARLELGVALHVAADGHLGVEGVAEDASRRVKETQKDIDDRLRIMENLNREAEKDVRDTMRNTESRLDEAMRTLDKELNEKLQEALDNPLSK